MNFKKSSMNLAWFGAIAVCVVLSVFALIFTSCTKYEDEGVLHTFHRMEAKTPNGVMGNSWAATKEKGFALAKATTEKLVAMLSDESIWDLPV